MLAVLTAGGFLTVPSHASVLFTLPNFNGACSGGPLTCVGNATTTGTGGALQLTDSVHGGETGAAYNSTAITLGPNSEFSTTFQFRISDVQGIGPADGFTFVLAASPTGLGGSGQGLGYETVPNSVAIEFDTYDNGTNDGNSSNHVAIDENGHVTDGTPQSDQNLVPLYGNAICSNFAGPNNYQRSGCLSNGDIWSATIGFDGSALSLSVWDQSGPFAKPSPFTVYSVPVPVNISGDLGTNNAFIGFTAGDAAGYETHDILNWSLANDTSLASPEPAPVAMLIGGFVFCWLARRKRRVAA
jgi:hypothetical protein